MTDLIEREPPAPSPAAIGVMIDWLDSIAEAEGFSPSAKDSASYAFLVGYALRTIEEADGSARALNAQLTTRLEHARLGAPEQRQRMLDFVVSDPSTSDETRRYLKQIHERAPKVFDREVIDALVDHCLADGSLQGNSNFTALSGYGEDVWRIFAMKLTAVLNAEIAADGRSFPWEAIAECLRFGYVLRIGDAVNGWE